jgi:hypothetical protein
VKPPRVVAGVSRSGRRGSRVVSAAVLGGRLVSRPASCVAAVEEAGLFQLLPWGAVSRRGRRGSRIVPAIRQHK